MASRLLRLEKLEQMFKDKAASTEISYFVRFVKGNGTPCELRTVREMHSSGLSAVGRTWERETGEDEEEFLARVRAARRPGRLLITG